MALDLADVRHAAALAHIALDEEELADLAGELAGILAHIGRIGELELADVPPTAHALDLVNVLAEDVPRPSLSRDLLLANAPDPTADGFRVPPIGA